MKQIIFFTLVCTVLAFGILGLFVLRDGPTSDEELQSSYAFPSSPDNASYLIGDLEVSLRDGKYENDGVIISLLNTYVSGDVDGDTDDDAVLVLRKHVDDTQFEYYLSVALFENDGYLGLTAVPLDAAPTEVRVRDELIEVTYQGGDGDDLQIDQIQYFVVTTAVELLEIIPEEGVGVFRGMYSRTSLGAFFTPCGDGVSYKLSSDSNSLAALKAIATERKGNATGTTDDVYVVLTGSIVNPEPEEETDANEATFSVRSIVRAPVQTNEACYSTSTDESVPL